MGTLPKKFLAYCRKNKIKWVFETEDHVEFAAPEGRLFPNEESYRVLDMSELHDGYITEERLLWAIEL